MERPLRTLFLAHKEKKKIYALTSCFTGKAAARETVEKVQRAMSKLSAARLQQTTEKTKPLHATVKTPDFAPDSA